MSVSLNTVHWSRLAKKALQGDLLTQEEALSVLQADDEEALPILQAAFQVRKHFYGKKVKLNMIINAKSGLCPEDCGYCSQSIVSNAPIEKYAFLDKETLIVGAREAQNRQAGTYCIVASGRGPTERELEQVIEAVREIRETMPLKICACLGILKPEQAARLKEAGVHRYNHNVNTSRIQLRSDHVHSHLRPEGRNRRGGQAGRAVALFRSDHRDGRDGRRNCGNGCRPEEHRCRFDPR